MSEARPLVLVADDEEDIIMLVDAVLSGAGFDVLQARDGARAVELVRERRPQLAVLDVAMPELDGLEVMRRVHCDPATANLPIVFLSARAQEADVKRAYELGASKYVRKPFSPRELVSIVSGLLDDV